MHSVNAYSTTATVERQACTLVGEDGKTLLSLPLTRQSDWNWSGSCRLPEAYLDRRIFVTAETRFSDGSVTKEHTSFVYHPEDTDGSVRWVANVGANILYTRPVVVDGKVFVASLDEDLKGEGAVLALDAATGKQLWRYPVRNSVKNTIAYHEGRVFAQDAEGFLYAIDAERGTLCWEKKLRDIEHKKYDAGQFIDELKQQITKIVNDVLADNSNRRVTIMTDEDLKKKPQKKAAKPKPKSKTVATATPAGKQQDGQTLPADDTIIGKVCPACGKGHIIKGKTAYGCDRWREGCTFRLPFKQ